MSNSNNAQQVTPMTRPTTSGESGVQLPRLRSILVAGQLIEGVWCDRCRSTIAPVSFFEAHEAKDIATDEQFCRWGRTMGGLKKAIRGNGGGIEKAGPAIDSRGPYEKRFNFGSRVR